MMGVECGGILGGTIVDVIDVIGGGSSVGDAAFVSAGW